MCKCHWLRNSLIFTCIGKNQVTIVRSVNCFCDDLNDDRDGNDRSDHMEINLFRFQLASSFLCCNNKQSLSPLFFLVMPPPPPRTLSAPGLNKSYHPSCSSFARQWASLFCIISCKFVRDVSWWDLCDVHSRLILKLAGRAGWTEGTEKRKRARKYIVQKIYPCYSINCYTPSIRLFFSLQLSNNQTDTDLVITYQRRMTELALSHSFLESIFRYTQ